MSILAFAILRYILFTIELLAGEFLFIYKSERKKNFFLRLFLCILVLMGVAVAVGFLFMYVRTHADANSNYDIYLVLCSGFGYLLTFQLSIITLGLCFQCQSLQITFSAISGFCARHLVFSCYLLLINLISPTSNFLSYGQMNWITGLIYLLVYAFLYTLLYFFFAKRLSNSYAYQLDKKVSLLFGLVLIVNVGVNMASEYYSQDHFELYIAGLVVQIVCMLLVFFVQTLIIERLEIAHDKEVVDTILNEQKKQFKFADANAKLLSIKAHDLKHQVAVLRKGGEEAEQLLRELEDVTASYDTVIKTDNETINVILSEKCLYCQKHKIRLSCSVDPKALSFMSDVDVYSLLGNIIDNAIEAVLQLENKERRTIAVTINNHAGIITIASKNYYEGQILIKNGHFISKKGDSNNHGFGMQSINTIVKKYNGNLEISTEDQVFDLHISFVESDIPKAIKR